MDIQEALEKIRQETNYFNKAKLLKYLNEEHKVTIKRLSDELSMKPAYICHILRLNKLPDLVVDGYYSQLISISHLFIIARLKAQDQMALLYEKVLEKNLTALQTEELVRETLYEVKSEGERISKDELRAVQEKLDDLNLDIGIKLTQTRVKGKLVFETHGSLKDTSEALRAIIRLVTK